jgi:hypothetical protein
VRKTGTLEFPWLTEELGALTETHKRVVTALEVAGVEAFVRVWPGLPGRPPCDRAASARAFVAKAVIRLPTTVMLIDTDAHRCARMHPTLLRNRVAALHERYTEIRCYTKARSGLHG